MNTQHRGQRRFLGHRETNNRGYSYVEDDDPRWLRGMAGFGGWGWVTGGTCGVLSAMVGAVLVGAVLVVPLVSGEIAARCNVVGGATSLSEIVAKSATHSDGTELPASKLIGPEFCTPPSGFKFRFAEKNDELERKEL